MMSPISPRDPASSENLVKLLAIDEGVSPGTNAFLIRSRPWGVLGDKIVYWDPCASLNSAIPCPRADSRSGEFRVSSLGLRIREIRLRPAILRNSPLFSSVIVE